MARINLLPWRAERRKQREREFYMQLGVAAVAGIIVILLWGAWMGARIDNQSQRNAYLHGEIRQLDAKISKIKDLEKVRQRLLARKGIIEQLQANRSQMVHLFDEMVKTIPSSVRLTALKQTGNSLTLKGVAQSNASVARYMRNLEASPWMKQVDLHKTENRHDGTRTPYTFGVTLTLTKPDLSKDPNASPASATTSAEASASAMRMKSSPQSGARAQGGSRS